MIRSLRHFALGVPELKAGVDFYEAFGLETVDRPDHVAMRCHGRDQDQVVLVETGRDRKFHHIAFGTDAAGLAAIKARLEAAGVTLVDPPYAGAADGLWFHDSDHNLVNVAVTGAETRPKEAVLAINRPGHYPRAGQRGCPTPDLATKPRRLGHLILFTPDVPRQARFYCTMLGMRLSDTLQDGYGAFLRTGGDSDHHVLGLLNSSVPGFHHASFEMGSIDEAALGAVKLKARGYQHAWGPGRHAIGSNYFHYFRDPWNGMAEYFYDIDYIPDAFEWTPKEWTKKDGMFLWSADGPPPPDFGKNYEAY